MKTPRIRTLLWAGTITVGGAAVLAWLSLATPVLTNAAGLASEKVYIIPEESNLLRFRPTEMNNGSGDWWIYGEDPDCYYHFEGSKEVAYHAFKRSDVAQCPNFEPRDYETWCAGLVIQRKSARITEFWTR
ncbi:hypothetical protein [Verrucomicrobium sp. BvORR106]|uniref:hypothetical protein n=1 Tax=Verrucomicrobium sp. BvORR106 TaxID=1403819 RepID=UPI002240EA80|nr:hypothetical protein [Verrucomicrobium sp. BvORR106]